MKYKKLHKFNSKKEKNGNFCWPAENDDDDEHRNSAHDDEKNNIHQSSNNNSQKIRSLAKAINRVISMSTRGGENNNKGLQLQNSPPTSNRPHCSGFDQVVDEEDFEKFKNHQQQTDLRTPAISRNLGLDQLEEDLDKFKINDQTPAAPGGNLSFDQLQEDFGKFKNIHEQQQTPPTPARNLGFYLPAEEDFGKFKNHEQQIIPRTPARCLSFDQLEEDFEKFKNGSSATPWLFKSRMDA